VLSPGDQAAWIEAPRVRAGRDHRHPPSTWVGITSRGLSLRTRLSQPGRPTPRPGTPPSPSPATLRPWKQRSTFIAISTRSTCCGSLAKSVGSWTGSTPAAARRRSMSPTVAAIWHSYAARRSLTPFWRPMSRRHRASGMIRIGMSGRSWVGAPNRPYRPWAEFGLSGMTVALMEARAEAYLARLLARYEDWRLERL
jgi:hypothetical protein